MDKFLTFSFVALQEGNVPFTMRKENKFIMKGERYGALIEKLPDGEIVYIEMDLKSKKGITKRYYSNGSIFFVFEQIEGIKNGKFIQYYFSGNKYIEATFQNNKQIGTEFQYRENGSLEKTTSYENGIMHGKMTLYLPDGSIESEHYYQYDKLVISLYYNQRNGKVNSITNFDTDGEIKEYYSNNICSIKSFLKEYKLHGVFIRYDMKGKIHTIGMYENGIKKGEFTYFDTQGKITHKENF